MFVCVWNVVYQLIKHVLNATWKCNPSLIHGTLSSSSQNVFDQLVKTNVSNANKRFKMFLVACKRLYLSYPALPIEKSNSINTLKSFNNYCLFVYRFVKTQRKAPSSFKVWKKSLLEVMKKLRKELRKASDRFLSWWLIIISTNHQ